MPEGHTEKRPASLLIVGCGDIGRRAAALASAQGIRTVAAARFSATATPLQLPGVTALPADLDEPSTLESLPTSGAAVLYLAPPPEAGPQDSRVHRFCVAMGTEGLPERVVYVSTSAVYGDCASDLVDETRPPAPQSDRGRRRLDAETTFRLWGRQQGVAVIILRVAGIYGPGRLPLENLQKGMPVLRPDQAPPSNRIHAEDLARICLAAVQNAEDGDIFNVCDGQSSSMSDYFIGITEVLGLQRPPEVDREEAKKVFSPMLLSYLSESRRLDNRHLINKLGIRLRYPDLRSGLEAIRDGMV